MRVTLISFTLEAANPDEQSLVLFARPATHDRHPLGGLERNDLLFRELDPILALTRSQTVLPELEYRHVGLFLPAQVNQADPARSGNPEIFLIARRFVNTSSN
jgi:hypothetical protein